MKALHTIAYILLFVGGLNWLVLALFKWDVSELFGGMETTAAKVIYILVGLSAIWLIATHKSYCKHCNSHSSMPAA